MTTIQISAVSVADFLEAPKTIDIISEAHRPVFLADPTSLTALNKSSTTHEIKHTYEDFKVVCFSDRMFLLRRRNKQRRVLLISKPAV